MRTTSYIHVNSHQDAIMWVSPLNTGSESLHISAGGSDMALFLSPEQLLQLHATLGAYISDSPDKFIKHKLQKLEEVKND
jgi:hypothetical protein